MKPCQSGVKMDKQYRLGWLIPLDFRSTFLLVKVPFLLVKDPHVCLWTLPHLSSLNIALVWGPNLFLPSTPTFKAIRSPESEKGRDGIHGKRMVFRRAWDGSRLAQWSQWFAIQLPMVLWDAQFREDHETNKFKRQKHSSRDGSPLPHLLYQDIYAGYRAKLSKWLNGW